MVIIRQEPLLPSVITGAAKAAVVRERNDRTAETFILTSDLFMKQ